MAPESGAPVADGLLLLSGGLDSPVAGRLLIDAGYTLEGVHFDLQPFTDAAPQKKTLEVASHIGVPQVTVVSVGVAFQRIADEAEHRLYFVLTKRLMVRIADALAIKSGIRFLASGENLGQVSSQTLANLSVIDAATTLPLIRPLLAYDKEDIIREAERMGTYELTKGPEVCDVLGPPHPITRAKMPAVLAEEEKVNTNALAETALQGAHTIKCPPPTTRNSAPGSRRMP